MFTKVLLNRYLFNTKVLSLMKSHNMLAKRQVNNKMNSLIPTFSTKQLTTFTHYCFSQPQQLRYHKDPQLYHMNKNIQQLKKQSTTPTIQLISEMHTFAQQLANKLYFQQAIIINQQVIKRFQQYYTNQKEKNQILNSQRILYYRFQKELCKKLQNKQQQVIQWSKTLIKISNQMIKQNPFIYLYIIDQQLQLSKLLYANKQIQQALNVLNNMYQQSEKHVLKKGIQNIKVNETLIKARNLHAKILIQQNKLRQSIQTNEQNIQTKQQNIKNNKNQQNNKLTYLQKSFNLLNQNLSKLLSMKQTNRPKQQLSDCAILLTRIYALNKEKVKKQDIQLFLQKVTSVNKQINYYYSKNIRSINFTELIQFYRNTANLYQHLNQYNKAILGYRQQKQLLKDQQSQQIANCIYNQARLHVQLKKQQKAVQKLIKSYQIRCKIIAEITKKKRKTVEQQLILTRNIFILQETTLKISQLYKKLNNIKKYQQWKQIYHIQLQSNKNINLNK